MGYGAVGDGDRDRGGPQRQEIWQEGQEWAMEQ